MHRLLIILMIALLPLRSWAGDVMAVSMSAHALAAASVASLATVAPQASADMQDCAGHADTPSDTTTAGTVDNGHCKTCVTCQICHSIALVNVDVESLAAPDVGRLKSPSATPFASAMLADSVKPPIS